MSPSNVRRDTREVPQKGLPKCKQNKDDNRHAIVGWGEVAQEAPAPAEETLTQKITPIGYLIPNTQHSIVQIK